MIKKLTAVFVSVLAVCLILAGCSSAEEKAEKFVKEYYDGLLSGEITPAASYDDYLSQLSKDLLGVDREQYIADVGTNMSNASYKLDSIVSVVDFEDTVYKVKCKLTVDSNGTTVTGTVDEYVINEDGKFKLLQYGVQSKQDMETSYASNALSMTIDTLYTGPDVVMINLIAKNSTTSAYAVGYGGNARIVVETDQGSYESVLPGTSVVDPMDDNEGYQIIKDVKGTIKNISIYNIYELDASNEPKDLNSPRSYVLYQADEPAEE